jgi:hypothetical protein
MQKGIQQVAFYFAAHEDDWQLFMNPSAFYDEGVRDRLAYIHGSRMHGLTDPLNLMHGIN